jgi:hypothetical protein
MTTLNTRSISNLLGLSPIRAARVALIFPYQIAGTMDLSFVILIEMLYAVASLVLISAGLAVVFGMMKVINLAHGEFR